MLSPPPLAALEAAYAHRCGKPFCHHPAVRGGFLTPLFRKPLVLFDRANMLPYMTERCTFISRPQSIKYAVARFGVSPGPRTTVQNVSF